MKETHTPMEHSEETMKDVEYFKIAQRIHSPERLIPPPTIVKQLVIRQYAWQYGLKTFIETGTYRGDMVDAMRPYFDQIYSIELGKKLYRQARRRFRVKTGTHIRNMVTAMRLYCDQVYSMEQLYNKAKKRRENEKKIHLIHGDSGEVLGKLIPHIAQPCLFWLDGHFSGGETTKGAKLTPVWKELNHILAIQNKKYVILIDDAREFGKTPDYPTLDEITKLTQQATLPLSVSVQDDIIRIVPISTRTEDR